MTDAILVLTMLPNGGAPYLARYVRIGVLYSHGGIEASGVSRWMGLKKMLLAW